MLTLTEPLPARARSAPASVYLDTASNDLECPCCQPAPASSDSASDLSVLGVQALTLPPHIVERLQLEARLGDVGEHWLLPHVLHEAGCQLCICRHCGLCECLHLEDVRCPSADEILDQTCDNIINM